MECITGSGTETETHYEGADNLRAMRSAVHYQAWLTRHVTRTVHAAHAARVVDFGAGLGDYARPVSRLAAVTCVEPDASLRDGLEREGFATTANIADLPAGAFDLVYSLNVLEHIRRDVEALRQVRRVLAPGGSLLLYVPAFACLYSAMDAKVGHYRRYRYRGLAARVQQAGLQVISGRYADSLGFLAALAYRVARGDGTLSPASVAAYDRFVFPVSRVLDTVLHPFFGKNLWLVARAPDATVKDYPLPCEASAP